MQSLRANYLQLLHQMNMSLKYIKNRSPPGDIPGQPRVTSFAEQEAQAASQTQSQAHNPNASQTNANDGTQPPLPPPMPTQEEYQKDIRELSKDLVLKEQQIEVLIASLPGLNSSETEQVERMKALERELESLEGERLKAVNEKESLLRKVEEKIGSIGCVR